MSDTVQYVILCEDLQSQVFIRRTLIALGENPSRFRLLPLPSKSGGGAGSVHVLRKYVDEVKVLRRRAAASGLVVQIDADPIFTVGQRHEQFKKRLVSAQLAPRSAKERIIELVPKRNIETWIYALDPGLGFNSVDEEKEYPKLAEQSECHQAAKNFADLCKNPPSTVQLPSLEDGIEEMHRRG